VRLGCTLLPEGSSPVNKRDGHLPMCSRKPGRPSWRCPRPRPSSHACYDRNGPSTERHGPAERVADTRGWLGCQFDAVAQASWGKLMSAIALYEEDPLMCTLLQEWLRSAGFRVEVGGAHRTQFVGRVDLVIASVSMPKHAGRYSLQALQAAHPGAPLIALSGQFRGGLSSAGTTAQGLGVARVIAKPLTRDTLLKAVHAMINPMS